MKHDSCPARVEGATRGTGLLSRATAGFGSVLAGAGIATAAVGVARFAAGAARAAIRVEGFTNAFEALGLSATAAGARVEELQRLSSLPGIRFDQAAEAAVRLQVVGITGSRATDVIRELGNALALTGDTDLSGLLLGLTQIVQRGSVSQEEINQLTERSGLLAAALTDAFGTTRAESINATLESSGKSVQDFVDILTNSLSKQARVSVDSTANSLQNLQNSFGLLQAAIGERFVPVIGSAARGISGFLDNLREGIEGTTEFTEVLANLNAELTRTAGTIQLAAAIDEGVDALEGFIRQSEAAIKNNSVFFGAREDAILIGQINQAKDALAEYLGLQDRSIETEQRLRAELVEQENELARIQGLQTDRNELVAEQGRTAERASRIYLANLTKEEIAVLASIDDLENKLTAFEAIPPAIKAAEEPTEAVTEKTKALTTEVLRLTEVYNGLTRSIQQASEQIALIAESGFGDFFRLVRGEITAYNASIDTVIPSLINFQNEQDALNASIQAGIDATKDAVGDPLTDYINSIGLTSEAADNARSTVEKASDAVVDLSGNAAAAERGLRDLDDSFQLSEATIPRVTSAMRAFTGTAPDVEKVERAVEQTTRSVDDLLDSLGTVGDGSRHLSELDAGFLDISERTVPRVARSITDAFVAVAEGDEITDAFSDLGNNIGLSVVDSLSDHLADGLSNTLTDAVTNAIADEGLLTAAGGVGSTIGAGIAIAVAAAVTAIPIIDLINRAINPPEPSTDEEIDQFNRNQFFQRGDPRRDPNFDPNAPPPVRTATRDGTRRIGEGAGTPAVVSVSEGRLRRDRTDRGVQGGPGPQNAQQFLAVNRPTDDQERGVVAERITPEEAAEEAERVAAEALANVIEGINDDVALINTAIAGLEQSISTLNDPAEIEQLLAQIAVNIPERYRLLRDAASATVRCG